MRLLRALAALMLFVPATCLAQGVLAPGIGPVFRLGTGGAQAVEPASALYLNPALLQQFDRSQFSGGMGLLLAERSVDSTVPANAFGPGVPPVPLSGSTRADSGDVGVAPFPAGGLVYRPDPEQSLTFGTAFFQVGGLYANYPSDPSNPILSPPPPNGFGVGNRFTLFRVMQIVPTAAWEACEGLSIGVSPVVNVAGPFPTSPNPDGSLPVGAGTHPHYGLGFHIGLVAELGDVNIGFTYKSRQWFETFKLHSTDNLGFPRLITADIDLPESYDFSIAWLGLEGLVLTGNLRFVDNDTVDFFGKSGFRPDGSGIGLGWQSTIGGGIGVAYEACETVTLRAEAVLGQSPVPDSQAGFNVTSPAHVTHSFATGFSWQMAPNVQLHFTYLHAPTQSVEGPIQTPAGAIPGSSVRNTVDIHSVLIAF